MPGVGVGETNVLEPEAPMRGRSGAAHRTGTAYMARIQRTSVVASSSLRLWRTLGDGIFFVPQ